MRQDAVRLVGLSKRFEHGFALKPMNLSVEQGEFFCLVGPSGSGKSTLLRLIAGFEQPTAGSIYVDGCQIDQVPAHRRPVNVVFQNYALFPHLNVADNLAFGLKMRGGLTQKEIGRQVDEVLELVKLTGFANRSVLQLSGGQKQRIALARAIINKPKILLLDEPLSAQDLQLRDEMQSELKGLQARLGMSFIMVSHDQAEALALSSKVAVLKDGALEQVGTPQEIYNDPQSVFVAKFIGNSNLLEGTFLASAQGIAQIRLDGGAVVHVRDNALAGKLAAETRVVVWVKPQAITFGSEEKEAPPSNCLAVKIQGEIFKGSQYLYRLQSPHGFELTALTKTKVEQGAPGLITVTFATEEASFLLPGAINQKDGQGDCILSEPSTNDPTLSASQSITK